MGLPTIAGTGYALIWSWSYGTSSDCNKSAYLKRDEDCSDAIQETIYKSYRAIRGLKEPAHFKTWLLRILIHECMHMLRIQKRMRLIESASIQGAAVKAPYETVEIRDAVSCLENDLRVMIQLHYYQDLPIKRIASMIKVPEGTVKSRLHRARTLLAKALEPSEQRRVKMTRIDQRSMS